KEAAILDESRNSRIAQWIQVTRAGVEISQVEDLLRNIDDVEMLESGIAREGIGSHADAVANQQGILALGAQCERQVGKHSHTTLTARHGSRHGIRVGD